MLNRHSFNSKNFNSTKITSFPAVVIDLTKAGYKKARLFVRRVHNIIRVKQS